MKPASAPQVASPCVRNCCLDAQDICLGCGRSLAEILEWGAAGTARREAISNAARERRAAAQQTIPAQGRWKEGQKR